MLGTFSEFIRVQNDDRCVKASGNQHKFDVGAAISRPPRWMYNLWGGMVPPKIWYPTVAAAICRHPAARPESWYVYICNSQTRNVCHSDRSVSGVEESTTLENEPPQDKACYLGRFLDSVSLRSE